MFRSPLWVELRAHFNRYDVCDNSDVGNESYCPTGSWTWQEMGGSGPKKRYGHTSVFYHGHLVVFAGYVGKSKYLNDLWEFDVKLAEWREIHSRESPTERYGHSAVIIGSQMYIFGGKTATGVSHETVVYDIVKERFTKITTQQGEHTPCARYGHSSVTHNKHMFIHGGYGKNSLNDFWQFNTDTTTWTQIMTSGSVPKSRMYHSSVVAPQTAHSNPKMISFGGWGCGGVAFQHCAELDLDTFEIVDIPIEAGFGPSPRFGHAAAMCDSETMMIVGGRTQHLFLDDLHVYHLPTKRWHYMLAYALHPTVVNGNPNAIRPDIPQSQGPWIGDTPGPLRSRSGHTITCVDGGLLLFGGYQKSGYFSQTLFLPYCSNGLSLKWICAVYIVSNEVALNWESLPPSLVKYVSIIRTLLKPRGEMHMKQKYKQTPSPTEQD